MVKMFKVESSTVVSIGWENNELYVEYKGGTYKYDNVPEQVFLDLLGSKSRGRFINENVIGKYNYNKLA